MVVIDHGNGEYSFMAHMITGSNDHLLCGQSVSQGQRIGYVGSSGRSTRPHLHFSTLDKPNSDLSVPVKSFPMYFNNVEFATKIEANSSPTTPPMLPPKPRRQLDVNIPSGTKWTILEPPTAIPANPLISGGIESEPNDTPEQHNTLAIPGSVSGVAEYTQDVVDFPEDIAIRGDGIEDIFRIDVASDTELRFRLESESSENLDLYVVTENFRVQNPSREGTRVNDPNELMCLNVDAGAHYLMVTNNDLTKSTGAAYDLTVEPDPQRIDIVIDNPSQPIDVDDSCSATVQFTATIEDGCCLDENELALNIIATNPTSNASVGPAQIDSVNVSSGNRIIATGHVEVSDLTSSPAEIVLSGLARDCQNNPIASADNSGDASTTVVASITLPIVGGLLGLNSIETALLCRPLLKPLAPLFP